MWSETVKFDILEGDQYLNVCIWCKFQDKNEKDALVGYVRHIPLASFGVFYCSILLDYVYSLISVRDEREYIHAEPVMFEYIFVFVCR